MPIENVGPGGVSNAYGQRAVSQPSGIASAGVQKPYYNEYTEAAGGGGGGVGVSDGDKGDVIVSGTGTVWTLDPTVYNEDLGTIFAQVSSSATEISAGTIVIPANVWSLGKELIISGKAVGTGAATKFVRARMGSIGGSSPCQASFTTNTGAFELKICRTAGTDASATVEGTGSGGSGSSTGINTTAPVSIVLTVQAAAAESLTITWAKSFIR
jgi:hypothetical protein